MTQYEVLALIVGVLGTIMLPLCFMAMRGIVKWTRVEGKLDQVAANMAVLVKDKDKIHQELADQMREDRKATNDRLRYLEMHVWGARLCTGMR